MSEGVIVAVLSLIGTLGGSLGGILASTKLTTYRIQELEKKVDKHSNISTEIPVIKEQIKELWERIKIIEKEMSK